LENLEEVDKFLDTYDYQNLNQETRKNLNNYIMDNEIAVVTNNFSKKGPRQGRKEERKGRKKILSPMHSAQCFSN
jgi:hypothetical protein